MSLQRVDVTQQVEVESAVVSEQSTGIGVPTSPKVQAEIIADVGGVLVAVQYVNTVQAGAEFFACVELTTDDDDEQFGAADPGPGFGRFTIPAVDVAALGPGFGRLTIPAVDAEVLLLPAVAEGLDTVAEVGNKGSAACSKEEDAVLRDLLDLREAVFAAQDRPGRSQQQCFAVVRSVIARSSEIFDLSPVAAAVLAEIQLHIGQPSLPAISGDRALPAGSFDSVALLEGFSRMIWRPRDWVPEGLVCRGWLLLRVL